MQRAGTIKVTYNGETKRVRTPDNYQELLQFTQANFPNAESSTQSPFKFFFFDEDNELISISSQDDFDDNCEFIQVVSNQSMNLMNDPMQSSRISVPQLIYSDSAAKVLAQVRMSSQMVRESEFDNKSFATASSSKTEPAVQNRMMQALSNSLKNRFFEEAHAQGVTVMTR